jgi:hypothetical protein
MEKVRPRRHLAAILAADVADYSKLMRTHEEGTHAVIILRAEFSALKRQADKVALAPIIPLIYVPHETLFTAPFAPAVLKTKSNVGPSCRINSTLSFFAKPISAGGRLSIEMLFVPEIPKALCF